MLTKKIKSGVFVVLSVLMMVSCTKDRIVPDETTPQETNFESGDLSAFFSQNALENQVFVIDTGGEGIIQGKQGTIVCLGDDPFEEYDDSTDLDSLDYGMDSMYIVDSSGSMPDLPVELHMVEIYTPGDMIFGQMPPMNDGEVLETVGEVSIQMYKGGSKLSLGTGRSFGLMMPSDSPSVGKKVFYSSSTPGDNVSWAESGSSLDEVEIADTNYLVTASQFGWLGCQDYNGFSGTESKITFVSDSIPFSAMKLYVVFPGENAVQPIADSLSQDIPVGTNVKVMAFALDAAGTYYEVLDSITIAADQRYELKFKTTTATQLAADIKGL